MSESRIAIDDFVVLAAELPISPKDLPGFQNWVRWKGFSQDHPGYDFAVYADADNNANKLNPNTPVRAIADGRIMSIRRDKPGFVIHVIHEQAGTKFISVYGHLSRFPDYNKTVSVRKGEELGNLFPDASMYNSSLIHLNFGVFAYEPYEKNVRIRPVDPASIFPNLDYLIAHPQGMANFGVIKPR